MVEYLSTFDLGEFVSWLFFKFSPLQPTRLDGYSFRCTAPLTQEEADEIDEAGLPISL
jgi:hypothetical protein